MLKVLLTLIALVGIDSLTPVQALRLISSDYQENAEVIFLDQTDEIKDSESIAGEDELITILPIFDDDYYFYFSGSEGEDTVSDEYIWGGIPEYDYEYDDIYPIEEVVYEDHPEEYIEYPDWTYEEDWHYVTYPIYPPDESYFEVVYYDEEGNPYISYYYQPGVIVLDEQEDWSYLDKEEDIVTSRPFPIMPFYRTTFAVTDEEYMAVSLLPVSSLAPLDTSTESTPEPSTLLGLGLLGMAGIFTRIFPKEK
jgi:hypothetical protein